MFARKYQRVAASNQGSLFLEVTGDESTDLRVNYFLTNVQPILKKPRLKPSTSLKAPNSRAIACKEWE